MQIKQNLQAPIRKKLLVHLKAQHNSYLAQNIAAHKR